VSRREKQNAPFDKLRAGNTGEDQDLKFEFIFHFPFSTFYFINALRVERPNQ